MSTALPCFSFIPILPSVSSYHVFTLCSSCLHSVMLVFFQLSVPKWKTISGENILPWISGSVWSRALWSSSWTQLDSPQCYPECSASSVFPRWPPVHQPIQAVGNSGAYSSVGVDGAGGRQKSPRCFLLQNSGASSSYLFISLCSASPSASLFLRLYLRDQVRSADPVRLDRQGKRNVVITGSFCLFSSVRQRLGSFQPVQSTTMDLQLCVCFQATICFSLTFNIRYCLFTASSDHQRPPLFSGPL